MSAPNLQGLRLFLLSAFSDRELRIWLADVFGEGLLHRLPSSGTKEDIFDAAVDLMRRQGAIDARLFEELARRVPGRLPEVKRLAVEHGLSLPALPDAKLPPNARIAKPSAWSPLLLPAVSAPLLVYVWFDSQDRGDGTESMFAAFILGQICLTALALRLNGPFYASLCGFVVYLFRQGGSRPAVVAGAKGAGTTALTASGGSAATLGLVVASTAPLVYMYAESPPPPEAPGAAEDEPAAREVAAGQATTRRPRTTAPPPDKEGSEAERGASAESSTGEPVYPDAASTGVAQHAGEDLAGVPTNTGAVPGADEPQRTRSMRVQVGSEINPTAGRNPTADRPGDEAVPEEDIKRSPSDPLPRAPTSPKSVSCPPGMKFVRGADWTRLRGVWMEIPSLCFDAYEVTIRAYSECVRNKHCTPAGRPERAEAGSIDERRPITDVTWSQARKYCAARGGRLPSEWEWQWAAQSRDRARRYPWGDAAVHCMYTIWTTAGELGCGDGQTARVGSRPLGRTLEDLFDMAGNVAEWTNDNHGGQVFIRGGSWNDSDPEYFRTDHRRQVSPLERSPAIGFRCVREPPKSVTEMLLESAANG